MYTSAYTLLIAVLLICTPGTLQQSAAEAPIVATTLGKIQGSILKSQYGAEIYAFRGIYYAQPPRDQLRFAPPEPVKPWPETLKATSDALICPQFGPQLLMSENCLALNVFSGNLSGRASVMVYIHGGANVLGSGNSLYEAGPQYLLDHDVVLVAFNYRLGALGFLSTGTAEAAGNYGYLDQVLALKWVQAHIAHFGGDPNLVTIFGLSAGSMAVSLHLASPLSKGLFQRAIAMSGSATNSFSIDNLGWTRKLAREVSCPMYNPSDIVECLRNVSWKTIVNVCSEWEPYKFTNMKWNYEIDGHFLPQHPTELLRSGNFNRVPLLAGITKNELDFSVFHQENNTGLLNDISLNFDLYAPELFLYNGSADNASPKISERLKSFYLGNSTSISRANLQKFGEIFSDSIIGHGVHRLVELTQDLMPVYYYRMDYVGRRSLYMNVDGKPRGVGHADDLQYVMPGLWYGVQFKIDDPDMFMVNRMTKWWTSFAQTGVPFQQYEGQWKQTNSSNEIVTLYNDKETQMGVAPYRERFALWDAMFPVERSHGNEVQISAFLVLVSALLRRLI